MAFFSMKNPLWEINKEQNVVNFDFFFGCLTGVNTSSEYIKATKSLFFKFIWKKQDKIKREVMSLDESNGSYRAPNIELMPKSLMAW